MTAFKTLDALDPKGKRILLRVDLNVPMDGGRVTDATRIERVLPTINELSHKGGRVVLLAHFGRPKGQRVESESLRPVIGALEQHLKRKIVFADDCVGPDADKVVASLKDGDVALLENTRFHKGEEKNDPALAAELAKNGDVFVNDAFSAAHRAHASTEGLTHILPSYAGRTMQAELEALSSALTNPAVRAMALVPASNGGSSKAPKGPFHTSVLHFWSKSSTCATLFGPTSRIISSAPT